MHVYLYVNIAFITLTASHPLPDHRYFLPYYPLYMGMHGSTNT